MRRLSVVGIGSGDPDHLTLQAIRAIGAADVFFVVEKPGARDELAALRRGFIAAHGAAGARTVPVEDPARDRAAAAYREAVQAWRDGRRDVWEAAIERELADGESGAFLVWGDPAFYDSTIAVLDDVRVPFELEVIPGISSLQALAAQHRIPLNRVGAAVHITPGRQLLEHSWPAGADDVVVMLDASQAYRAFAGEPLDIYWGAYVGSVDEVLVSGPLDEATMTEIETVRARERERKGWIMDTYVLRRRRPEDRQQHCDLGQHDARAERVAGAAADGAAG